MRVRTLARRRPELTEERSSTAAANGDDEHEKLRIVPGMQLYAQDDDDARFEIEVLDKPSRARIRLRITRLD